MTFAERLEQPVNAAPVVFFRIAFGLLMAVELTRYLAQGWVRDYWITPTFHFTYMGFEWLHPWPGVGMLVHFVALIVLAVMIVVGYHFRVAAALFWLGFTYVFLLDQSQYLNHFYAISLFAGLLALMPAHVDASVDAWRKPALRSSTVPTWALWSLRFQMGVIYFFGGIAKLNSDWLHGQPLTLWLQESPHLPELLKGSMGLYLSWGGAALDLFVVPLLLWPRTRMLALVLAVSFHLTNSWMFEIGVFPWLSIAATAMFLSPDHPLFEVNLERFRLDGAARELRTPRWVVAILAVWVVAQLTVPLRHFLYPGNPAWTEDGHMFAWHMKLRDKAARGSFAVVVEETGEVIPTYPAEHLTMIQESKMYTDPEMILQYARHLAATHADRRPLRVYAKIDAGLNGRDPVPFTDPTVDLSKVERTLGPTTWIMPLVDSPLPETPRTLSSTP